MGGGGKGASLGGDNLLNNVDPFATAQFTTDQAGLANRTRLANQNIGGSNMNAVEQGGAFTAGAEAGYGTQLQAQKIQQSELAALANASNANASSLGQAAGLLGGLLG